MNFDLQVDILMEQGYSKAEAIELVNQEYLNLIYESISMN